MPEHLQGEIKKHLELAREAPGTHEAALLERIAEVVEDRDEGELVIFDTAPSGHTTELVHAMEQIGNALPLHNPPPEPLEQFRADVALQNSRPSVVRSSIR